jgi:hypothetical protein
VKGGIVHLLRSGRFRFSISTPTRESARWTANNCEPEEKILFWVYACYRGLFASGGASLKQVKGVVRKDAVQDHLGRLSSEVCSRPCDKETAALVRNLSM